ncbi:MAG: transketolase [Rhizobiales bacterium]|nr:transketolase [Hyphomicrobiales bacterium]
MALSSNHPPETADIAALRARAHAMRRHMLVMARGPGQGYVGQGLGIADVLAAIYFHELRWDPADLLAVGRDRFLLSTGHYSIVLWAALAEAGVFAEEELTSYGADDSRLDMSTLDTTPGVEMIGGSLGHGLGQAVGMALGLRLAVDCNGIQADGPVVLDMEPVADKWRAFGFATQEIDGNDMVAVVGALHAARARDGRPHAIVLRTQPGFGIPTLMAREKAHFVRVDAGEWDALMQELDSEEAGRG